MRYLAPAALALSVSFTPALGGPQQSFTNWETPHVSPIQLSDSGERLFVCNTADGRLEVLDVTGPSPVALFDVPVGIDPVSVRQRTANEVWVVNSISDSISVVDLSRRLVIRTIDTDDEPADVVFAGTPERAFVSCSQPNTVLVIDPAAPTATPVRLQIEGEEPRAMQRSADGSKVYVAIFESGNGSTILGGGLDQSIPFLNNVVSDPAGPYGGQNPPPNDGTGFEPAMTPGNPTPPPVGLIVKKDSQNRWMDDNGGNWTELVSGPQAQRSNRPMGWDVLDNDVAIIDTQTLGVTYAERLMNINMALAVHPISGAVTVVGTDATNEIRFEPNLNGVFLRVQMASVPAGAGPNVVRDMNPHLDYQTRNVPQATRDLSIGDPRGIAWTSDGARAYVTGMGSNNVAVFNGSGARVGAPIEVGEGPTGIVIDDASNRAFTVNKFDGSISTIDLVNGVELTRTAFHDPSPEALKIGRRHLYDTHGTSGLGHVSCGSCHVDSRNDRLAWDLGDPAGLLKSDDDQNLGMGFPGLTNGFEDWHPMKGPMTTQTLQDIIGHEPMHWRGDKDNLGEFSPAFTGLQADDAEPSTLEMQEFKEFLRTIYYPPNPFRNFDNSLPTNLPLPGHFSAGRFSPAGTQLPNGNAAAALTRYIPPVTLDGPFACATCHTLPTGMGPNYRLQGNQYVLFPEGPDGEKHHGLVTVDGSTNKNIKIAQLRNLYEKVGMDITHGTSRNGFGFLHDGSIPSLSHFLSANAFEFQGDGALANMIAFMLAFSGSDLPNGSTSIALFPPGTASQDTHAGVGTQVTITDFANASQAVIDQVNAMVAEADLFRVGLVARGSFAGLNRGASYLGSGAFQTDRAAQSIDFAGLMALATAQEPVTLTVVPSGSETRLGIDRDLDGRLDRDEIDAGSDPADPSSVPDLGSSYCGPAVPNSTGSEGQLGAVGSRLAGANDVRLVGSALPPNVFGLILASKTQGFVVSPVGGNLCLGGDIGRFNGIIQGTGQGGRFDARINLTNIPTNPPQAVLPGDNWNFQFWHRDVVGGAATANFTLGLSIDFE